LETRRKYVRYNIKLPKSGKIILDRLVIYQDVSNDNIVINVETYKFIKISSPNYNEYIEISGDKFKK